MAKKLNPTQQLEKELNDIEIEMYQKLDDKKAQETLSKKRIAILKKLGRKP